MTNGTSNQRSPLMNKKQTTAVFMPKTDKNGIVLSIERQRSKKVTVHFNPESLDITFTNSVQSGKKNQPAQVSVTETTAKLGMELVFDTTLTGIDVRIDTNKLARMMDPNKETPRANNNDKKIPSIVIFQWGTIWFEGYIDSYREKLDFFSSEGVPLRATVTLSMTQQQRDFQPNTNVKTKNKVAGAQSIGDNAVIDYNDNPINRVGSNSSLSDAINAGNPSAAGNSAVTRCIGAANGIENIRLPEVNEFVIPSFQARRTVRSGISVSFSGEGAGLQAKGPTEELFSNLKTSMDVSVGAGLSFDTEGHFNVDYAGGSSMSADVGLSADIEPGIKFEG